MVEQGQSVFDTFSNSVHFAVTVYGPDHRKTSKTDFHMFAEEVELNSVFLLSTSVSYLSRIEMLPIWPYGCVTNLADEEFFITSPVIVEL